MNKVICIVGPTAIGKSALAIALAKMLDSEIINGDSIQMYQELDILSAKPTILEQEGIKHHLLDFLKIDDEYDISRFKVDATKLINELNDNKKIPVLVGGSGLYLKSLLYDYELANIEGRSNELALKYDSYTNDELFAYLKEIDSQSASILHPNNRKRVLRAIEIFENSGASKSDFLAKQKKELVFDALIIGLETPREKLYQRINTRVDQMLDMGLEKEVTTINNKYLNKSYQALQAIGYKEFLPYLNNEISLDQTIDKIKQNSRRYAKKQLTWFNNQMKVMWIESDFDNFQETIDKAIVLVKEFVK